MSWALSMMASAIPGRPEPVGRSPATLSRVRSPLTLWRTVQPHAEHAKKTRCLHGCLVMRSATATIEHRCRPADRRCSIDAVEAGLRWLTDRWPGGTIRNEPEVYSGYCTEASSVSQAN